MVLRKYMDDDLGRQKQALYALQHLMHRLEHPNSEFITADLQGDTSG